MKTNGQRIWECVGDPMRILIGVAETDLKSDNSNIEKVQSKSFVDGRKSEEGILRLIKRDKFHKEFCSRHL